MGGSGRYRYDPQLSRGRTPTQLGMNPNSVWVMKRGNEPVLSTPKYVHQKEQEEEQEKGTFKTSTAKDEAVPLETSQPLNGEPGQKPAASPQDNPPQPRAGFPGSQNSSTRSSAPATRLGAVVVNLSTPVGISA